MPEPRQNYAKNMPELCQTYARACQKYDEPMWQICLSSGETKQGEWNYIGSYLKQYSPKGINFITRMTTGTIGDRKTHLTPMTSSAWQRYYLLANETEKRRVSVPEIINVTKEINAALTDVSYYIFGMKQIF